MREKFVQLFAQPKVISRAIVPMHQLGFLSAYLPQWKGIEGLMQFDLFHIYTVDEHTVRVMLNLENFSEDPSRAFFPLCHQLFATLSEKPLLYLAALSTILARVERANTLKLVRWICENLRNYTVFLKHKSMIWFGWWQSI